MIRFVNHLSPTYSCSKMLSLFILTVKRSFNGLAYKIIMSFQGIRKIRDTRRDSPLLLERDHMSPNHNIKPIQLNLDLKSSHLSGDLRTTKDSEIKPQASPKPHRKNSLGRPSSSKDKEKKIMIGNFLRINLDSLKNRRPHKEIRNSPNFMSKTQRVTKIRKASEEFQSQEISHISLNSYNLDFIVGKGGFGKVWKVVEKSTNRIYAMKEMQKVKIISKRSAHSVMNQQKLLQRLKNPFLVNMHCSFQNRENLFLVMDYCNRGDLRYHLGNKRKFKEEETRFFLACIVLCLEYMHREKVIHRDLKPQNLVIDQKGYIRVTDLGVSREVKANNAEDTSGTPGYMSPEVICKMNHSFPTDYFALGVMAFQFMTGKRPYVGANRKQIREKILAKQIQLDQIPPYGWSKESIDFINRLIQRKPEQRLGYNGIQEIKYHPFFKKIDWEMLNQKRMPSPFLPPSIEQDYTNYKQCISEDTEIQDMQEYRMILRHKDTQEAFIGYDFNTISKSIVRKQQVRQLQLFSQKQVYRKKK